jgi:hypothetical protein
MTLAPVLKRLHGSSESRNLAGVLRIKIGKRPLTRLLLWLCCLPRVEAATPTRLQVVPSKNGERWQRYFGHKKFFTYQHYEFLDATNGSKHPAGEAEILERFGPVTIHLQICVRGGSLRVRSTATRLLGITLPSCFSVGVVAHEKPINENSFYSDIRLSMPRIGRLLRYSGTLSFQDSLPDLQSSRNPI